MLRQLSVSALYIGAGLLYGAPANADVFISGSSFTATATNFPGGSGPVASTIGGTTNVAGLTMTTTVTATGSDGAWIDISFSNPTGGSLAGNTAAFWQISVTDLQLAAPGLFDNFFLYFSEDGQAVDPISSFGGIINQGNLNPIDPSLGPVFFGTSFAPGAPITDLDLFANVNPYSFISAGGMDPNEVNDFHIAAHITLVTPTRVPEPATMSLLGATLIVFAVLRRRRKFL